jgi:cysteine desulfurase
LIYLDHNATTPIAPEVRDAMLPYLEHEFGNPSSTHAYGATARAAVDRARAQVAALLGCDPAAVVFCASGSEADNLAIKGAAFARLAERGHLITSPIEPGTVLVSIMHANNEVGTVQPIAEIAEAARERDVLVHTDAAQSVGKLATHVDALGVDLLTVAGHKLYAPKGIGALFVMPGTRLDAVIHGGGKRTACAPEPRTCRPSSGSEQPPSSLRRGCRTEPIRRSGRCATVYTSPSPTGCPG